MLITADADAEPLAQPTEEVSMTERVVDAWCRVCGWQIHVDGGVTGYFCACCFGGHDHSRLLSCSHVMGIPRDQRRAA
jgi:hypothetical protein